MKKFDYKNAKAILHKVDDAGIAVRQYGEGRPVLLIHGFGVFGYTWRKILPGLSENHRCVVLDLLGFGGSEYSKQTNFTFTAQAERIIKIASKLRLGPYSIIAHDTGASIARLVALKDEQVEKLVLINTEIPSHRPPFIPMYQFLAKFSIANVMFRLLMRSKWIV